MKDLKTYFTYALATILVLGYFGLIVCLIFKIVPTENKDLAGSLFSTMTVIVVLVVKHFFDGTKETATRDLMLYNASPETPKDPK